MIPISESSTSEMKAEEFQFSESLLRITYHPNNPYRGLFGLNQCSDLDRSVLLEEDYIILEDCGHEVKLIRNGNELHFFSTQIDNIKWQAKTLSNHSIQIRISTGETLWFDNSGRLVSLEKNSNSSAVTFLYSKNGKMSGFKHKSRLYPMTWDNNRNLVLSIGATQFRYDGLHLIN